MITLRLAIFIPVIVLFVPRPALATENDLDITGPALVKPAPDGHYDEIYSTQVGREGQIIKVVRPQYRDIVEAARDFDSRQTNRITHETLRDFSYENSLSILPKVLLESEEKIVRKGVEQRARALRAFANDYIENFIPRIAEAEILPSEVFKHMLVRSGDSYFWPYLAGRSATFLYGPDIVRDARGRFLVGEDNIGNIGGFGDLQISRDAMNRHIPEYAFKDDGKAATFYRNLAENYATRARETGGTTVLLMSGHVGQQENLRLKNIFAAYDIVTVADDTTAKLVNKQTGVWLRRTPDAALERVGFVISKGVADGSHPAVRMWIVEKLVGNERMQILAKPPSRYESRRRRVKAIKSLEQFYKNPSYDFEKREASYRKRNKWPDIEPSNSERGIYIAMLEGLVDSNYLPGLDFLADKGLYIYVEKMIEFYLGEKPILRNIPTYRPWVFSPSGEIILDESVFKMIHDRPEQFVIKPTSESGGEGVVVGAKVPRLEFDEAIDKMRRQSLQYVVQRYQPMSVVGSEITDIRLIVDVPRSGRLTMSPPWGRGGSLDGDGRLNVSLRGKVQTVVVRPDADICRLLFHRALPPP